jgi:hypothetical protein
MTTPAGWTGWLLGLMAGLGLVSHDEIDEHKGSYGRQEIQAILEAAGFRPDKVRTGYFEAFANNWAVASS